MSLTHKIEIRFTKIELKNNLCLIWNNLNAGQCARRSFVAGFPAFYHLPLTGVLIWAKFCKSAHLYLNNSFYWKKISRSFSSISSSSFEFKLCLRPCFKHFDSLNSKFLLITHFRLIKMNWNTVKFKWLFLMSNLIFLSKFDSFGLDEMIF